jgi:signal transduction histidine kinase
MARSGVIANRGAHGGAVSGLPHGDQPARGERWKQALMLLEHEMRTPLAAALMQLNVVEHAIGPAGSIDRAKTVLSNAKRQIVGLSEVMRRAVEIESDGKVRLQCQKVDLGRLAAELVNRLRAVNPAVWCRVEVGAMDAAVGWWDASAIEQILENLLSNALKFGNDAPVRVAVVASEEEASIIVQDRGVGIAAEETQRIFSPFFRARSAHAIPGHGIGLWVVRHLVEAHGGKIVVRSRKGEGATFVVLLPLRHN